MAEIGRKSVGVVERSRSGRPKVAEYSNLGLRDTIPLGLLVGMASLGHSSRWIHM
jgi:hypothetical protein